MAVKQAKKSTGTLENFASYNIENNNYISIRELCDAFGVQIAYDVSTNSVNMKVK